MSMRHRVVIAVSPRLLGDTLSRALDRDELEIMVVTEGVPESFRGHADVLIVSDAAPADLSADVVIHLPEGNDVAVVTAPSGSEQVPIDDLSALIAAVQRYTGVD
jgi:hypothetical protein